MERIRWNEKLIPFQSLVENPSIHKPTLVQLNNKGIIVGEKINGEFIMASPCKVSGDRFDVMEEEIVLSSKHKGVWRVISKATSKREGHIHRLTTKDLERIHKQDVRNERTTPRSYICIRDIEAFELIIHDNDPSVANGSRIERHLKQIEEDVEFEIFDTGEVEYTPSEGERTSQDYTMVSKSKPGAFLQMFLPGVSIDQEQAVRNRVLRALYCRTTSDTRKRHFLLEVNEQPCEIRPIASEGSTELRYLHSTQNLYDYMLTYGNDTVLYVKLLRGDPPIKAIEFDGYMVLKMTLNGDKIPICRVEDLEITLVSPDLPVKVRLPTSEQVWRSLSEVRAAEVQCMQLALALLARHESEMYVTMGADSTPTNSYQEQRSHRSHQVSDVRKKHLEECEKVFGNNPKMKVDDDMYSYQSQEKQQRSHQTSSRSRDEPTRLTKQSSHSTSDKSYRSTRDGHIEQEDSHNRSHRSIAVNNSRIPSSGSSKTKTNRS